METIVIDNFKRETTEFVESNGVDNLHAQIDAIPIFYEQPNVFSPPYIDTTCGVKYPLFGYGARFSSILDASTGNSITWGKFVASLRYSYGNNPDRVAFVDTRCNLCSVWSDLQGNKIVVESPSVPFNSFAIKIKHFSSKLVLTCGGYSDKFYYINDDLSNSWIPVSFTSGNYVYDSLVFNNNLFLGGDNISGGQRISRYNTSFNLVGSLNINTPGKIVGLVNYNNQYITIFIRESNLDYMILWNGDINSYSSDRYYLPGRFLDGVSHNGVLYILIENMRGVSLFYFYNNGFKLLFEDTRYKVIYPLDIGCKGIIKTWNDYLVINYGSRIIFFSPQKNELFGVGNSSAMGIVENNSNYFLEIGRFSNYIELNKNWTFFYPLNINASIGYFKIDAETPGYMGKSFFYRSNWIVLGKRIKLGNIKLYYTDTPNPDYYLNVRVGYIDEKTGGNLQYKDYNFLQSQLPASYKEFSVNIECTKFFIMVWTDININTGSKSVKRVVIEYDRLE